MSKIIRIAGNAALFCLIWVMMAVASEAALRVTGSKPPGYVTPEIYGNVNLLYRPNSETAWRGNLGRVLEFDTPIRTNSIVQFDREHPEVKEVGVYRVLMVGDSFVEALQVPLEKWFGNILETALNQDPDIAALGLRVEIIKLGGSGNGAVREYELLKTQGLKYNPDLVLTFFTDSNDLNDDWHYYRRMTGREIYKHVNLKPAPKLYEKINFYKKLILIPGSWLNRWIAFLVTETREKQLRYKEKEDAEHWKEALGAYALPGSARFAKEAPKWKEAAGLTLGAHLKMAQATVLSGGRYAAVLVDRPQNYRADAYRYLFKIVPDLEKEVDLDKPAKEFKAALAARGIPQLDLNDYFISRFRSGQTGHYRYDGHWNAQGHQWAAEVLVPFVKERITHDSHKQIV